MYLRDTLIQTNSRQSDLGAVNGLYTGWTTGEKPELKSREDRLPVFAQDDVVWRPVT